MLGVIFTSLPTGCICNQFFRLNRHLDHIEQGVYLFFLIFIKPAEFEAGDPGWRTHEGMIFCEGDEMSIRFHCVFCCSTGKYSNFSPPSLILLISAISVESWLKTKNRFLDTG